MKVISRKDCGSVIVELTKTELLILSNSINEVCNGIDVPEFKTRLGVTKEEVLELLEQISPLV